MSTPAPEPTLLERLSEDPPVRAASSGVLRGPGFAARWDASGLRIEGDAEGVALRDIVAVQPSRSTRVARSGRLALLFGRLGEGEQLLGVELRLRSGARLRFEVPVADASRLAGLPPLVSSGAHALAATEVDSLVGLVHAARAAGATLVRFEAVAQDGADAPSLRWGRVVFSRLWSQKVEIVAVVLLLPLVLAVPTGWTEPVPLVAATIAVAVLLVIRRVVVRRVVVWSGERAWLACSLSRRGRGLFGARPLGECYSSLQVLRSPQGYALVLERRRPGKLPVRLQLERGVVQPGGELPAQVTELCSAVRSEVLVATRTIQSLPMPSVAQWMVAVLGAVLAGGWLTTLPAAEGEVARLGGWFTGHGDMVSAIMGTFTADYSLLTSPTAIAAVALSPDGTLAATVDRDELWVWRVDGARALARISLLHHGAAMSEVSVAFSADGERLFASRHDRYLQWRIDGDEVVELPQLRRLVNSRALAPGPAPLCASEDAVIAFEPDGQALLTRALVGDELQFELPGAQAGELAIAPGCQFVAWVSDGTLMRASLTERRIERFTVGALPLQRPGGGAYPMALSRDGRLLVVVESSVLSLLELSGGTVELRQTVELPAGEKWMNTKLFVFDIWDRVVVVTNVAGEINKAHPIVDVYDAETGKRVARFEGRHGDSVFALGLSADGHRVITGSRDQTAIVWALPGK